VSNSTDLLRPKPFKRLQENKENISQNRQDKIIFDIQKNLKILKKKVSYNNSTKENLCVNNSIEDIKLSKKLNKTLYKIKSTINVSNKCKNNTLDNFKKSKVKKFSHEKGNINNNNNFESLEFKNKQKKYMKNIKKVEIKFSQNHKEKNKKTEEIIPKFFDISKINNIQIPKEYINTIYYNLLKEQENVLIPKADPNYMKKQKEINPQMRSILIDWLIDVHFKFCFTDETLFMTISIIDRYCSVNQVAKTKLQLLGICALMIACKHEEIDVPKINDFLYITDNAYKSEDVLKMENDILSCLNFSLLYPSPIKFFEYLSIHFNFDKKEHMLGKYLMESLLIDIKVNKYKPATISCACAYIVMKFFKMENYREAYNQKFFTTNKNQELAGEYNIKECAKDICVFIDNINKTKYHSCLQKYAKQENEKVSLVILS
jgi:hypothetical protein